MADIVSILPHGILQRFLVELRSSGGDGITGHQVFILKTHPTLPLHILIKFIHKIKYISKLRMANRSILRDEESVKDIFKTEVRY